MSYTTLANVKAYLTATGSAADTLLQDDIDASEAFIDTYCRQSFGSETRTNDERAFPDVKIDNDGYLQIRVDKAPVTAVTAISWRVLPWDAWQSIDATLWEYYSHSNRVTANSNLVKVYNNLYALRAGGQRVRVKMSYTAGFATIPDDLEWLARRVAAWRFKQKDSAGEKIALPAMGQIIIPQAMPGDIRAELERWRRVV